VEDTTTNVCVWKGKKGLLGRFLEQMYGDTKKKLKKRTQQATDNRIGRHVELVSIEER
jgi:hypothetical protein